MVIMFVSNYGEGFSGRVEVEDGTTVGEFIRGKLGENVNLENYNINMDRSPVSESQVLKNGARLTMTPSKIVGA